MKKNINFTMSDETLDLISSCMPKKKRGNINEKDINHTLTSMMVNYMIIKKKMDSGYRVFMGKKASNLEYEYNIQ